jgi:hypothetical protein
VTADELIRAALARVAWIRESNEPDEREQALEDLEHDLARWVAASEGRREA